jgi:type IV conjugative transfer system coupling protein TraD
MSKFLNVIRGGQVQIHQFRMAKQILGMAATISILIGICIFAIDYSRNERHFDYCAISTYSKSWLLIKILPPSSLEKSKLKFCNTGSEQSPFVFVNNHQVVRAMAVFVTEVKKISIRAAVGTFISFLLIVTLWMKLGNLKSKRKDESGIYNADELRKYLSKNKTLSNFDLGGLPLVKNKETSHILFAGASGTGKSNAIKALLKQIREQKQSAIIIDMTGEYVDLFYDKDRDYILNPTDPRTAYWDLWEDGASKEDLSIISTALFSGENQTYDKFWSESAKVIFESAVQKFAEKKAAGNKYQELYQLLAIDDLKKLYKGFEDTAAASLINPTNEKTAFSIRSTTATFSKWLEYLAEMPAENEHFSIKKWMSEVDSCPEGSWLFLTTKPNQRKIMEPLLRMWADVALVHLMSLSKSFERRVWFIMDEMPTLGKLPSLSTMVAEARKYGGCIVGGIQSISQVYETYGHHGANIIIDGFSTKIFFRVTGIENTAKIAKIFGSKEHDEVSENITYGAHEMRDGVSLSKHTKNKLIVSEKDISNLEDLEAYAIVPCPLDIVKTKFKLFRA